MKPKREAAIKCIQLNKIIQSDYSKSVDIDEGINVSTSESDSKSEDRYDCNVEQETSGSEDESLFNKNDECLDNQIVFDLNNIKLDEDIKNISKIIMKSSTIDLAALAIRARDEKVQSGSSLLQWNFRNNFDYFNHLIQSVYWADKILINGNGQSNVLLYLSEALFPTKEYLIDISKTGKKIQVVDKLFSLRVNVSNTQDEIDVLPPLCSILAPNPVVNQHGAFINAGTYVKRLSWAPVNPEFHKHQFLAVSVYKDLAERINAYGDCDKSNQMIQIYNCGKLEMSSKQANLVKLEMILTHNWGKVTDISWSPQPLPAVCRQSQKLIGHLALCCSDGFIRIISIAKLSKPGALVMIDNNHPILCLGSLQSREGNHVFPTSMHWRPQFPDRIVAGYNTGHVGVFVLESSVLQSRSKILGVNIYLKPSLFRRVFDGPCRSVQISPYNWRLVSCSSYTDPNVVIVDFEKSPANSVLNPVDIETTIGSRIVWPTPGDVLLIVPGKHVYNTPGVMICPAKYPLKIFRKLNLSNVSSIDMCSSLNSAPIGTRSGQLHILSLNTNNINNLLQSRAIGTKVSREHVLRSKFYMQYSMKPITQIDETPQISVKMENRLSDPNGCGCPNSLQCVHKLISKFSISLQKTPDNETLDWQHESLVNVQEIAANPNPASSTWVAVALECGLIHIVPLTHLYQSNLDVISTGSSCKIIEKAAKQLCDEILVPNVISYFPEKGRRRKYPPGVNYSQVYRSMGKVYPRKKKPKIVENNIVPYDPTQSFTANIDSVISKITAGSVKTKSTFITEYFTNNTDLALPENYITSTPLNRKRSTKKPKLLNSSMVKDSDSINKVKSVSKKTKDNSIQSSVQPVRKRLRSYDSTNVDSVLLSPTSEEAVKNSKKSDVKSSRKRKSPSMWVDSFTSTPVKIRKSTRSSTKNSLEDSIIDPQIANKTKTVSKKIDIVGPIHATSISTKFDVILFDNSKIKHMNKEKSVKQKLNKVKENRNITKKKKEDIKINEKQNILKYLNVNMTSNTKDNCETSNKRSNLRKSLENILNRNKELKSSENCESPKNRHSFTKPSVDKNEESTVNPETSSMRSRLRNSTEKIMDKYEELKLKENHGTSNMRSTLGKSAENLVDKNEESKSIDNPERSSMRSRLRNSTEKVMDKNEEFILNENHGTSNIKSRLRKSSVNIENKNEESKSIENPETSSMRSRLRRSSVNIEEKHFEASSTRSMVRKSFDNLSDPKRPSKSTENLETSNMRSRLRYSSEYILDKNVISSNNLSNDHGSISNKSTMLHSLKINIKNDEKKDMMKVSTTLRKPSDKSLANKNSLQEVPQHSKIVDCPSNDVETNVRIRHVDLTRKSQYLSKENAEKISNIDGNIKEREPIKANKTQRKSTVISGEKKFSLKDQSLISNKNISNQSNIYIAENYSPGKTRKICNIDFIFNESDHNPENITKTPKLQIKNLQRLSNEGSEKIPSIDLTTDEQVKENSSIQINTTPSKNTNDLSKSCSLNEQSLNSGSFVQNHNRDLSNKSQKLSNETLERVENVVQSPIKETAVKIVSDSSNSSRRFLNTDIDESDDINTNVENKSQVTMPNINRNSTLSFDMDNCLKVKPLIQSTPKSSTSSHKQLPIDLAGNLREKCHLVVKKNKNRSYSPIKITSENLRKEKSDNAIVERVSFNKEELIEWQRLNQYKVPVVVLEKQLDISEPKIQETLNTPKSALVSKKLKIPSNKVEDNSDYSVKSLRQSATPISNSNSIQSTSRITKENTDNDWKSPNNFKRLTSIDDSSNRTVQSSSKVRKSPVDKKIDRRSSKVSETKKSKTNKSIDTDKLKKLQNIFSLKRQELLESQQIQTPRLSQSVVSPASPKKPDWWDNDKGTERYEMETDINKIDDISLGSPRKRINSVTTVDDRMDKIKKVINRGLSQSVVCCSSEQTDSPELLHPFQSLISKSYANLNNNYF